MYTSSNPKIHTVNVTLAIAYLRRWALWPERWRLLHLLHWLRAPRWCMFPPQVAPGQRLSLVSSWLGCGLVPPDAIIPAIGGKTLKKKMCSGTEFHLTFTVSVQYQPCTQWLLTHCPLLSPDPRIKKHCSPPESTSSCLEVDLGLKRESERDNKSKIKSSFKVWNEQWSYINWNIQRIILLSRSIFLDSTMLWNIVSKPITIHQVSSNN